MKMTPTPQPTSPQRSLWKALACLLPGLLTVDSASAATLKASADTRTATSGVLSAANNADLGVGPITATNYTRTYLTFDLTTLTTADVAVTAKLKLFNTGGEANTSALAQVYTLFQVASDWNGAPVPGPEGTALATVNLTPSVPTDTKDIEFSGPQLVAAFNSAIGGKLHLGIKSDKEGAPNRSFTFFNSTEDAGREPTLTTSTTFPPVISVSVTDATAAEPGTDTATFTLNRSVDTSGSLTVFYTFSGTATNGSDYTDAGGGSVTFAPGATTADVVITPVNDDIAERLETIILNVSSNAAYDRGTVSSGTATLADNNDDNNNVLLRYIFTDAASITNTFSRAAQVYSPDVTASALLSGPGSGLGNSSTTVSPPNAGYVDSIDTAATPEDSIANGDYFSFTVTPVLGKSLTLTNLELSATYIILSSAGINGTFFIRSSLDNYASDLASQTFTRSNPYEVMSIPLGAAFTNYPKEVTFRVYTYDDTDTMQDGVRVDDIFVRGTADPLQAGVQQVILTSSDTAAGEPADPASFTITRAGDTSAPVTIRYSIGGTATNGVDYALISDQVTLDAGVTTTTITVSPIDEVALEGTETITLTLLESPDYVVFTPSAATIELTDDETTTLRPTIGTLSLIPATATYNRLSVTVTAEGALTATDTQTTDASGTLISLSNSDVNTGNTLNFTLMTNGSTVTMTPMNFDLRAAGISVATLNIANLAGTAFTELPPGTASPSGAGASFDASLHRVLINQGTMTGELTIPFQPTEPINDDFVSSPLTGLGSGTGTLTLTPASRNQSQQFFNAVMTLPVDFTQNESFSGTPVTIRVQGTLRATGTVTALLDNTGEIASWSFNTGTTSAERRAAGNVIPEALVSALAFNSSFVDVGVDVVPAVPNDGVGFGSNGGDLNLRLRRASYYDNSAVPTPRPTELSYTSWGDGASAGTGATLSADGNAPIAFTVTANADKALFLSSVTVEWTNGSPISFQLQEAGAAPGPSVNVSGVQNTRFTIPLQTQVAIDPGQTKTFTLNLNSNALDTATNIDTIALNGVVVTTAPADPYLTWSQANGLTAGVNDGFEDNPDGDALANGLEWILGGTSPLVADLNGSSGTSNKITTEVDGSRNLILTFPRIDDSEGLVTLKVQFSNDVFVTNNQEVTIGASGPEGLPPSGVTVQVVENGTAADTVTVTIPSSYYGAAQRLFARLAATRP